MNNKGYALMDALAGLGTMLFISFFLLPVWWKIEHDRMDVRKSLKAQQILYENLQSYYDSGYFETEIEDPGSNGRFYTVIQPMRTDTALMRGCVTYENSQREQVEFCDVIKAGERIHTD
ncbi:hypothetical protein IEO70_07060 [Bacillus sp. AGMB 02131]|uniref:Uncharacterized protein n=1 Tax=Peribacillus faecalis TaxID=2772559 RepID=A0A927CUM9_9BACI|nr:hypothetical protein [Peribacillus faecalis]MBD3108123.1 hypothetical protein [Peribacillus faecalis]